LARRLRMPPNIGELVERLKLILLCPLAIFVLSRAHRLLLEIDHSAFDDAVFYLKQSGFLFQEMKNEEPNRESPFKCAKRSMAERSVRKPSVFYTKLLDFAKLAKDLAQTGAVEGTFSTCTYFLDDEAEMVLEVVPPTAATVDYSVAKSTRTSMTNIARGQRSSERSNNHFAVKNWRIGLPNLPEFESSCAHEIEMLAKRPSADFTTYPACPCGPLYSTFMQIYVIFFQLKMMADSDAVLLVCRLLYGYIVDAYSAGIQLSELVALLRDFGMEAILDGIALLEHFEFVHCVHSLSAMPHFVADIFANPHLHSRRLRQKTGEGEAQYEVVTPHFWVRLDGSVDLNLRARLRMKIAELVEDRPGIEVLDLTRELLSLTPADLLALCDVLVLDEVIYSVYLAEGSPGGLFGVDDEHVVCQVDNHALLYGIAVKLVDPSTSRVLRRFYPCRGHLMNLSVSLTELLV
jgi:hypothetical protein